MFKEFFTELLYKMAHFLGGHQDFFAMSESDRKAKLDHLSLPHAFKDYLLKVKGKDFVKDMDLVLKYLQDEKRTAVKGNAFFEAAVRFFNDDLSRKIDYLDGNFYLMDGEHRQKIVDKLIQSESALAMALKNVLLGSTYQQLADAVNALSAAVADSDHVLVQSPREIDLELRKKIRKELSAKYANTLPVFQINKKLIGGIRVFENGQVVDHSWLSRVLNFTSITSK